MLFCSRGKKDSFDQEMGVHSVIEVRPATRDLIELIAGWQVTMAVESENIDLDRQTVISGVTRVFDEPAIGYYLVAVVDGTPAGCCLVLREWSDWRNGEFLWIHSVYTVPSYRRRGVFQSIYRYLENKVKSAADLRGLRLYVDRRNHAALATYQSLGMTDEHYRLCEWMKEDHS